MIQLHSEPRVSHMGDPLPDYSLLEGDRLKSFERGEWHYIGIEASAEIVVHGVVQSITSGGLWNVESDSGPEYLDAIGDEQVTELKDILRVLRVDI